MNIPVLQNDHLRAEYDSLTYQGTQPFEQYVKQFKEYKDKLKKDSSDDDKKKKRFLNRIFTENEDVNATAWQLADDNSITYKASKNAMKNPCDEHLSTGLYTQPSDDELYSIPDSSLPTQNEIEAMSCTIPVMKLSYHWTTVPQQLLQPIRTYAERYKRLQMISDN